MTCLFFIKLFERERKEKKEKFCRKKFHGSRKSVICGVDPCQMFFFKEKVQPALIISNV